MFKLAVLHSLRAFKRIIFSHWLRNVYHLWSACNDCCGMLYSNIYLHIFLVNGLSNKKMFFYSNQCLRLAYNVQPNNKYFSFIILVLSIDFLHSLCIFSWCFWSSACGKGSLQTGHMPMFLAQCTLCIVKFTVGISLLLINKWDIIWVGNLYTFYKLLYYHGRYLVKIKLFIFVQILPM